jgi:4-cresol dehydrogenase (hydroxylating) flavoprotein subunit
MMVMTDNLLGAFSAWSNLLGIAYVLQSPSSVITPSTATFSTHQKILAIIRPGILPEIQECLRIANRFKTPVYPISSGKNWGYGSAVPVETDCVIMDLSRLNRIVDFNEELGYITLEPGVTQGQLFQFLKDRSSRLWMDATGSGMECSVIGNTVERGFGHTPYGDHFASVCGMEVVLPCGDCFRTGFGRFPNSKAASVFRWGVGPYIDGLFTQSNLGIVTKMTIWLMPAPEYFQAFNFSVAEDQQLEATIEALRPLRLNGTLKSAIHIGNDYKALSANRQYPWEITGNKTPLPAAVMQEFSEDLDFGAWNGFGGLYGSREEVAAARNQLIKALKGKVKTLRFFDDRKLRLAAAIEKPYRWLTGKSLAEKLKLFGSVYDLMQGIPTEAMLASTYWRKKSPVPTTMNPDQDQCGLIWCAPVLPTDSIHVRAVLDIVTLVFSRYPFEPAISMAMVTERSLSCVISISYDRELDGEDERAMACYQELFESLMAAGYYPYRLGIQSMGQLKGADVNYQKMLRTLKLALDPNNILAPGRYE